MVGGWGKLKSSPPYDKTNWVLRLRLYQLPLIFLGITVHEGTHCTLHPTAEGPPNLEANRPDAEDEEPKLRDLHEGS